MGRFLNGLMVGVGVGLLVAPMKGEEIRRLVGERLAGLRASLPNNGQLAQYQQLVTDRVSQAASVLKDNAQQAATQVQSTGNTLADTAQQAASEVKQASQDVTKTTKQTARSTQAETNTSL